MTSICERCGEATEGWLIDRAEFRVGRIHRLPLLCRPCARTVEDAVQAALRSPQLSQEASRS